MAERGPGWFLRLLGPEGAAAAEAESRGWLLVCPNCGLSRSVWEMGAVRYKASGTGRRLFVCPRCGEAGWHRYERGPDFPTTTGPVWPIVRLVLGLVLAIWLGVAAILLAAFRLTGLI
jgi:predicted RNA-binding Zn-ribbon protein involved in translation (DUF1610 family)